MKLKSLLVSCVLTAISCIGLVAQQQTTKKEMTPKLSGVLAHLDIDGESLSLSDDESFLEDIAKLADKGFLPAVRGIKGLENLQMLEIVKTLGFDKITATGSSSKQYGKGHTKKLFIATKDNNRGIFSLLGTKSEPYVAANFAPASTDLIVETKLNLSQVYQTVMQMLKLVNPSALEDSERNFNQLIPGSETTIKDLLSKIDARISLAVELDLQNRKMPFRATLRIDNIANMIWPLIEAELKKETVVISKGNIHSFSFPAKDSVPSHFTVDLGANQIWLTNDPKHLILCQAKGMKLATSESFLAVTNGMPKTGCSQLYISKKAIMTCIKLAEQEIPSSNKEKTELQGMLEIWKEIRQGIADSEGLACALQKNEDGLLTAINTPFRIRSMQLLYIAPVLASIATPVVIQRLKDAERASATINLRQLYMAFIEFHQKHRRYPKDLAELATLDGWTLEQIKSLSTFDTDDGVMQCGYVNCDNKVHGSPLVYSASSIGGYYIILSNDGSVQSLDEAAMTKLLKASEK